MLRGCKARRPQSAENSCKYALILLRVSDKKVVMQTRNSRRKSASIAGTILVALATVCGAQTNGLTRNVLTNSDIVTLANAGFSEAFILQLVTTSTTKFDMTTDALANLAKNGITEMIIRGMRDPSTVPRVAAMPPETVSHGTQTGDAFKYGRVFVEPSPESSSHSQPHPQTVEIMKTFGESCPGLTVTNRREEATFVVMLDREAGKWVRRHNKMVVFNRSGDMIYQNSTRELGLAVRRFCAAATRIAAGSEIH